MDVIIRAADGHERLFAYNEAKDKWAQAGFIGYLRGYFDSADMFAAPWFFDEDATEPKTESFKRDFDDFINYLRKNLLAGRWKMEAEAKKYEGSLHATWIGEEYDLYAEYSDYSFVIRCLPQRGNYNFYIWCYIKKKFRTTQENMSPVYTYPWSVAKESGEKEIYRGSLHANVRCKEDIEKLIPVYYSNNCLDTEAVLSALRKVFPDSRIKYVLANTVQIKDWDARFSAKNKEWAATVIIPEDPDFAGGDVRRRFVVDQCHPGLTDLLVTACRKEGF